MRCELTFDQAVLLHFLFCKRGGKDAVRFFFPLFENKPDREFGMNGLKKKSSSRRRRRRSRCRRSRRSRRSRRRSSRSSSCSGSSSSSGGGGGGGVSSSSSSNKLLYLHDRIILQYCKSMHMTIKI